jgi:hypothetical protein
MSKSQPHICPRCEALKRVCGCNNPPELERGDTVWVFFCYEHRDGTAHATLRERVFEKHIPNYLNRLGPRLSLITPGKPFDKHYGMAYRPEDVWRTEWAAKLALQKAVMAKVCMWTSELEKLGT